VISFLVWQQQQQHQQKAMQSIKDLLKVTFSSRIQMQAKAAKPAKGKAQDEQR